MLLYSGMCGRLYVGSSLITTLIFLYFVDVDCILYVAEGEWGVGRLYHSHFEELSSHTHTGIRGYFVFEILPFQELLELQART